jgi:hypothetical protein
VEERPRCINFLFITQTIQPEPHTTSNRKNIHWPFLFTIMASDGKHQAHPNPNDYYSLVKGSAKLSNYCLLAFYVAHEISDEILRALQCAKDPLHDWDIVEPRVEFASIHPFIALIPLVRTIPAEMQQERGGTSLLSEETIIALLQRTIIVC